MHILFASVRRHLPPLPGGRSLIRWESTVELVFCSALVLLTALPGAAQGADAAAAEVAAPSTSTNQPVEASPGAVPTAVNSLSAEVTRRPATRIAVYELEVTGVDEAVANLVLESLLAELRKMQGVSVIGMNEVRLMLDHETNRQLSGCTDESCLADLAGALGVDALVTGSLAAVGDEHIFGLRRIDQQQAKVVGSISRRLQKEDGEEFLAAIGPAVEELFGEFPLRDGRSRGVADEVALRLNPPPLPLWIFASTSGVAVTAAAATLIGAGAWFLTALRWRGKLNDALQAPGATWADLEEAQALANVSQIATWGFAGVTLATATTALVLSAFTDFTGAGEISETASE